MKPKNTRSLLVTLAVSFIGLVVVIALTGCALKINPDGSKEVSLDAVATAGIIKQIIATK